MRSLLTLAFTLVLALAIATGCKWNFGSNPFSSSNSNSNSSANKSSNSNSSSSSNSNDNSSDSDSDKSDNDTDKSTSSDTGPVYKSVADLLDDVRDGTESEADAKYKDRLITADNGDLMEITSDQIKVGSNYNSDNYIVCRGSFSEYMSSAQKVSELYKSGRPARAEVKGLYKSTTLGSGYNYIELDPCVLSDIDKP